MSARPSDEARAHSPHCVGEYAVGAVRGRTSHADGPRCPALSGACHAVGDAAFVPARHARPDTGRQRRSSTIGVRSRMSHARRPCLAPTAWRAPIQDQAPRWTQAPPLARRRAIERGGVHAAAGAHAVVRVRVRVDARAHPARASALPHPPTRAHTLASRMRAHARTPSARASRPAGIRCRFRPRRRAVPSARAARAPRPCPSGG